MSGCLWNCVAKFVFIFIVLLLIPSRIFCQDKKPTGSAQTIFRLNAFSWEKVRADHIPKVADSLAKASGPDADERIIWYLKSYKFLYGTPETRTLTQKAERFQNLMSYLESCPVPEVKANFWYLHAIFCLEQRRFDEGFKWLFMAKGEFETIGYQHLAGAAEYLHGFGLYHYVFEDYKNAIRYLEQSKKYKFYTERGAISATNRLGMAFMKMNSFKEAEKYFKETIGLAERSQDSVYIGMGIGNYGNTLRMEGKAKESLPFLYKDFKINLQKEPGSIAITSIYIARSLLALDSITRAKKFIDLSIPLSKNINNISLSSYPLNYYEAQAGYYGKIGNERMASTYLDSTIMLRDSLSLLFNKKILSINQFTIEAAKYQANLLNLEAEKKAAVTLRNMIIVALLVVALGVYYVYSQKQQKLLAEKKLKEDQKRNSESLLASAADQLNQYVKSITEKNELINNINEELERLKMLSESSDEERGDIIKQRESLIKSVILTEKDWIKFRRLFERVYPDFLNIIKAKYPDLSAAETRLLVLLKLEVSNKEMAFILGVSIDAIRKSRQRLRKKLEQTDPGMELESLVAQL
jgi:tetratricopeptide (TPR) repeat protein